MKNLKVVARIWSVAVNPYAIDSSPLAGEYANRLLDLSIATSVQSLTETRDELKRIEDQLMMLYHQYEERSKGFHRSAMYKGKSEGFGEILQILASEIKTYDQRIEANKDNNGRQDG